jgi:hypothetical protein
LSASKYQTGTPFFFAIVTICSGRVDGAGGDDELASLRMPRHRGPRLEFGVRGDLRGESGRNRWYTFDVKRGIPGNGICRCIGVGQANDGNERCQRGGAEGAQIGHR